MKKRFLITVVENGYTIRMSYHFKKDDKDPGHIQEKDYVATTYKGLCELLGELDDDE